MTMRTHWMMLVTAGLGTLGGCLTASCTTTPPQETPGDASAPPAKSVPPESPSTASPTDDEPRGHAPLPGSTLEAENAIAGSSSIAVVRVTEAGTSSPGPPQETDFDGVQVRVLRVVQGPPLDPSIEVDYRVKAPPAAPVAEEALRAGGEYILFLRTSKAGRHAVHKAWWSTSANLERIRRASGQ